MPDDSPRLPTEPTAGTADAELLSELADLGVSTIYEAAGRSGLVNADLVPLIDARRAGPARTVACGQNDNRAVHAAIARTQPGDVLVLTMPRPEPVALIGELLVTQAKLKGASAILVDAAVRDAEDLRGMGLPIWTRWIRSTGASKIVRGELDVPVTVGGVRIEAGDVVVLDADGVVVVPAADLGTTIAASRIRRDRETAFRRRLEQGALSYDLHGLREQDEQEFSTASTEA